MDNKPSYGSQRCDDPLKRSKKSMYTAPFMVTWVILPSKVFKELIDNAPAIRINCLQKRSQKSMYTSLLCGSQITTHLKDLPIEIDKGGVPA